MLKKRGILAMMAVLLMCLLSSLVAQAKEFASAADKKYVALEHGSASDWSLSDDGKLTMSPQPGEAMRIGIEQKLTPASGYVITATVKALTPERDGHFGFMVRRKGKESYIHLSSGGKYLAITNIGGKQLQETYAPPAAGPEGYKLVAKIGPDFVDVSLNGTPYFSFSDIGGSAVGVALMAYKTSVEFSDFSIETLDDMPGAENVATAPEGAWFFENFQRPEKAAKKFSAHHGGPEKWQVANGCIRLNDQENSGVIINLGGTEGMTDFRFSAEVRCLEGTGVAGLQFRRDPGMECDVLFSAGNKEVTLKNLTEPQTVQLPESAAGAWLKLEVQLQGRTAVVKIDGKEYLREENVLAEEGNITLYSLGCDIEYRNLCVMNDADSSAPWIGRVTEGKAANVTTGGQTKTKRRGFMVSELTPEIVQAITETWNVNIVRLQLVPLFWAQQKGIPHKDAWKWMMEQLLGWLDNAKAAGVLVVIDLHNVPRPFPKVGDEKEQLEMFWNSAEYKRLFLEAWTDIANICRDRDEEIWFDLMNEPLNWVDMPSYPKKWPEWAQECINLIRDIDSNSKHYIVVEPGPGGLCWGFKDFPCLNDPMNKLIYSAHQYQPHIYAMQGIRDITGTDLSQAYLERGLHWPGDFSDNGGGWWDKKRLEEQEMACVIEFQKKHNAHIFIGEFSVCRWAPDAAQYLDDCISIFEKYGWDWTYHAFRESRIWSLEHEDAYTSEPKLMTTPTERAKTVKKYLDRNER